MNVGKGESYVIFRLCFNIQLPPYCFHGLDSLHSIDVPFPIQYVTLARHLSRHVELRPLGDSLQGMDGEMPSNSFVSR